MGLNPCFNGRYSQRKEKYYREFGKEWVLILVLMEDTLRVACNNHYETLTVS